MSDTQKLESTVGDIRVEMSELQDKVAWEINDVSTTFSDNP
jgi:hypothetical protein